MMAVALVTGSPLVRGTPKSGRGTVARIAPIAPAVMRFGLSLGSPTAGSLIGGKHLDETPYLRVLPVYESGDIRWGVEPLVEMLDRAGRAVRKQFPDAILSVGHLSRQGGGELDRHRSHESGRDADVGFFVRSASGKQILESNFVAFRGDGIAPTWPGAYFDEAKNWALVANILEDPEARVTHIFVASPLRARLLAYADRIGAPEGLRVRAAELLHQPRGSLPHDDHFHVRIACPAHMTGCVENPNVRAVATPIRIAGTGPRRSPPSRSSSLVTLPPKHPSAGAATDSGLSPLPAASGPQPSPDPPPTPSLDVTAPIDDVDG
jgi:penicillin-insensitive murein endopeptidase